MREKVGIEKREGGERDVPYLGRRGVGGALDRQFDPRNGLSGTVN